jgi:hypothetical protein
MRRRSVAFAFAVVAAVIVTAMVRAGGEEEDTTIIMALGTGSPDTRRILTYRPGPEARSRSTSMMMRRKSRTSSAIRGSREQ